MDLLDLLSGTGEVTRGDGTVLGPRRYDIELWQETTEADGRPGSGRVTAKATIELAPAERDELAAQGRGPAIALEDGRHVPFRVTPDGGIAVRGDDLAPRPRRHPGVFGLAVPMILIAAIVLADRLNILTAIAFWTSTRPYGIPVAVGVLALAALAIGLPLASRSRKPDRHRAGIVALALGFVSIWLVPYAAFHAARQLGWPEELAIAIAAFALLGGAAGLFGRAYWKLAGAW